MIPPEIRPPSESALNSLCRAPQAWSWMLPLFLALFALQSLWFIDTQSLTYDEPGHLMAGLDTWQHGRFAISGSAGTHLILPLARLWLMLPIASHKVEIASQPLATGYRVTAMNPGPEWLAWHTRPMNAVLGLALGTALWFASRRLFSVGAANVTLALFAFTPSLIANFSVATTDGIAALFVFLTAYQVVLWRRNPSRAHTVIMGVVLGGLLLAKVNTPPEMLLAVCCLLALSPEGKLRSLRRLNWKPALAASAVAVLTFWAGYLFHVSHLKIADGQVAATFPNRPDKTWATKSKAQLDLLLPAGEYFEGLREAALENHRGLPAWFLGNVYPKGGVRLFYPVAIALKWPTILLLVFFASLLLGVRKTCGSPGDLLVMSLFGLVFLAFALQSRIAIGERHILPLYPFALLIAGAIWEHARKHRGAAIAVVLALCLNAADALRYAPDYLAYFNIFVQPANTWRLLTDSNLDWGQGLIALRNYQQLHPDEEFRLAYFGSVDPLVYGIKAKPLAPGEIANGRIVIGATNLSGQTLTDSSGYRWLWPHPPESILDHSMWIFSVGSPLSEPATLIWLPSANDRWIKINRAGEMKTYNAAANAKTARRMCNPLKTTTAHSANPYRRRSRSTGTGSHRRSGE